MELMTKCPQCGTEFAAGLDQLQLRKGYIRCINCAHIFDGYEAVVPNASVRAQAPTAAVPAVPVSSEPQPPDDASYELVRRGRDVRSEQAVFSSPARAEPVLGLEDDAPDDDGTHEEGIYVEPRRVTGLAAMPRQEPGLDKAEDLRPLPEFLDERRSVWRGIARVFWSVLVLAGLALLAAQLLYIYRAQIAAAAPPLRPLLQQACEALQCRVDYPRRIEHIAITDSSLQVAPRTGTESPSQETGMQLRAILRNSDPSAQEWPTLALDLMDFSGTVVARRLIAPNEYLPADRKGHPFPARSELHIEVDVAVKGMKVNGYKLGKFFPPEG